MHVKDPFLQIQSHIMTDEPAQTTSEESMVLGLILPSECVPHLSITVGEIAIILFFFVQSITCNSCTPKGECVHIRQCTPACVTTNMLNLKCQFKSLKSIATSAIHTQSNRFAAKMITCNISSLYKQKLI